MMDDFDADWVPEQSLLKHQPSPHMMWFKRTQEVLGRCQQALKFTSDSGEVRYYDEMPPIDQDLYDWLYGRPQEPERDPEEVKRSEDVARAFSRTQG